MIEDIIHAEVHQRSRLHLLLQEHIPAAEALQLIGLLSLFGEFVFRLARRFIVHKVTVIGDGISVQHVHIVVAPEGKPNPAMPIFIREAEINLVLRFIQQLPRHILVAPIDRMQVSMPELPGEMIVNRTRKLRFHPRDFRLADILETVNHIQVSSPCPGWKSINAPVKYVVM